jgi:hypothetical protein
VADVEVLFEEEDWVLHAASPRGVVPLGPGARRRGLTTELDVPALVTVRYLGTAEDVFTGRRVANLSDPLLGVYQWTLRPLRLGALVLRAAVGGQEILGSGAAVTVEPARCQAIGEIPSVAGVACECAPGFFFDDSAPLPALASAVLSAGRCRPCPPGTEKPSGGGSAACVVCGPGTYSLGANAGCLACPSPGAQCEDGRLTLLPGFWNEPSVQIPLWTVFGVALTPLPPPAHSALERVIALAPPAVAAASTRSAAALEEALRALSLRQWLRMLDAQFSLELAGAGGDSGSTNGTVDGLLGPPGAVLGPSFGLAAYATLYECPVGVQCDRASANQSVACKAGSGGPLCAVCDAGWAHATGTSDSPCVKCWSQGASWVVTILVLLAGAGVIALLSVQRGAAKPPGAGPSGPTPAPPKAGASAATTELTERRSLTVSIARIFISWLQSLALIGTLSVSGASQLLRSVLGGGAAADGLTLGLFPLQCAMQLSFYEQLYAAMVTPLVGSATIVVLSVAWSVWQARAQARAQARTLAPAGGARTRQPQPQPGGRCGWTRCWCALRARPRGARSTSGSDGELSVVVSPLRALPALELPLVRGGGAAAARSASRNPLPAANGAAGPLGRRMPRLSRRSLVQGLAEVRRRASASQTLAAGVLRARTTIVVFLFLIHFSITKSVMRVFDTLPTPIAGTTVLRADVSVVASGREYATAAALAAAALLLYALGIPLVGLMVLVRKRARLREPRVMSSYGFLYLGYDLRRLSSGRYLWELVVLLRKVFLAAIASFYEQGTLQQGFLVLILLLIALLLHDHVRPYEAVILNELETLGLASLLFAQIGALYYSADSQLFIPVLVLVLLGLTAAIFVFFIAAASSDAIRAGTLRAIACLRRTSVALRCAAGCLEQLDALETALGASSRGRSTTPSTSRLARMMSRMRLPSDGDTNPDEKKQDQNSDEAGGKEGGSGVGRVAGPAPTAAAGAPSNSASATTPAPLPEQMLMYRSASVLTGGADSVRGATEWIGTGADAAPVRGAPVAFLPTMVRGASRSLTGADRTRYAPGSSDSDEVASRTAAAKATSAVREALVEANPRPAASE